MLRQVDDADAAAAADDEHEEEEEVTALFAIFLPSDAKARKRKMLVAMMTTVTSRLKRKDRRC